MGGTGFTARGVCNEAYLVKCTSGQTVHQAKPSTGSGVAMYVRDCAYGGPRTIINCIFDEIFSCFLFPQDDVVLERAIHLPTVVCRGCLGYTRKEHYENGCDNSDDHRNSYGLHFIATCTHEFTRRANVRLATLRSSSSRRRQPVVAFMGLRRKDRFMSMMRFKVSTFV